MQPLSPECRKILKKRNKIALLIGIPIILFLISLIFLVLYSPYIDKSVTSPYFSSIANLNKKNAIIIEVADLCSNFKDNESKLVCVNNFVRTFYSYVDHSKELKILRTPNELLNEGGVCRDYAVFYDSIMKKMNFKTEYIYLPHHVYLKVNTNNDTYYFDQTLLWKGEPRTENP